MIMRPRSRSILSAFIRWVDDWDDHLALACGLAALLFAAIELGETLTR